MYQFLDSFPLIDTLGKPIKLCDEYRTIFDVENVNYVKSTDTFFYNKEPLLKTIIPNVNSSRGTFYKLQGTQNELLEFIIKHFEEEDEFEEEAMAFELLKNVDCKVIEGKIVSRELKMIAMPSLDGDLSTFISDPKLAPSVVADITIRLAEILKCLYSKNIVYTDIKPANVLYRCRGGNRFDMFLGDVGDIINFDKNAEGVRYFTATYPWYEVERKNYWDAVQSKYDKYFKDKSAQEIYEWLSKKGLANKVTDLFNRKELLIILKSQIDKQRSLEIPYSKIISPITDKNAEKHIVWGVVMFYLLLILPQKSILEPFINSFWNGRNLTNDEFFKNVNMFGSHILKVMKPEWNKPLVQTIMRAFRDPSKVTLDDIINKSASKTGDKKKYTTLKF
jgi:serine/threonine protein kinase